jgi:hypothetical protein
MTRYPSFEQKTTVLKRKPCALPNYRLAHPEHCLWHCNLCNPVSSNPLLPKLLPPHQRRGPQTLAHPSDPPSTVQLCCFQHSLEFR